MESSVDTHRHGAGRRRDNRERLRQLYGTAQGLRGSRACQVPLEISTVDCNENTIYVFLFWELRGLCSNFHIPVSVSDLYIPRIYPHISCSRIGRSTVEIEIAHRHINVEIGTVAAQFLFWEYLFQIFGACIGSLLCRQNDI